MLSQMTSLEVCRRAEAVASIQLRLGSATSKLLEQHLLADISELERNKRILDKARQEDDEYVTTKPEEQSYYDTAHRIRERVVKQHTTLGAAHEGLKLKPYQLKG